MKRRNHSSQFKAKVGLEALKERETLQELAKKHSLLPTQISHWKQVVKERSVELFENKLLPKTQSAEPSMTDELYRQIGQMKTVRRSGRIRLSKKKLGML